MVFDDDSIAARLPSRLGAGMVRAGKYEVPFVVPWLCDPTDPDSSDEDRAGRLGSPSAASRSGWIVTPLREPSGLLRPRSGVKKGQVAPLYTPARRHCPNTRPAELAARTSSTAAQDHALQQRYGITCDDYWGLFERQDGRCAICRRQGRGAAGGWSSTTTTTPARSTGSAHFGCNRRLAQVFRRYLADPPGRAVGLVVPAAKLRRIEELNKKKARPKTKPEPTPPSSDYHAKVEAALAATKRS